MNTPHRNRLRTLLPAALALPLVLLGCSAQIGGGFSFDERDDLVGTGISARIDNGLSGTISFEISPDAESFLIEVQGDRGLYYPVELNTPSGRNLVEDAGIVTRSSRGNYGLANWLYPNVPGLEVEPGTYRLVIRGAANLDGGTVSEDIKVTIYEKKKTFDEECGIQLDFLVDDSSLAFDDFDSGVESVVTETDRLLGQAGVRVVDYTLTPVRLSVLDVDLSEGSGSILPVVDDVLKQARENQNGIVYARSGAMHILMVRSIGGTKEPKGRALGLPGPYDADKPNSAILLASEQLTDLLGYFDTAKASETLTHEIGHYMGLYHTSEIERDNHDPIADTAECTTGTCGESFNINIMSTDTSRRRYQLTDGQAEVIRRHPLCVPLSQTDYKPPPPLPTCDLECEAPSTCVIWNSTPTCLDACDPVLQGQECDSICTTSDDGVYVCRPN